MRTLAVWLGVRPEWLRYGETDVAATDAAKEPALSEGDIDLVRHFRRLNAGHRQAVRQMVLSLLRAQRDK